jgi:Protein of unknown function (DUF2652)
MNSRPAETPEPVLLIIADISGYTRYMTANAKTLAHSHTIITELVQAIIQEVSLPLEVAKLEGDAIFMYCRKNHPELGWSELRETVGNRLIELFQRFSQRLAELSGSVTCTCHACTHIERLRLKIVVHSGEALFHRVLHFTELAGVDVIIVHRLLKNSVNADQYLLMSDAARRDLDFSLDLKLVPGVENYSDIGPVNTLVYLPQEGTVKPVPTPATYGTRFRNSWQLYWKLWISPFQNRSSTYHNVTATSGQAARIALGALTVLLTPIMVPVGAGFVALHALKPAAKQAHTEGCHEHRPDGSCCHPPE